MGALNQLAVDAQVLEITTLKQQLTAMLQSPQVDSLGSTSNINRREERITAHSEVEGSCKKQTPGLQGMPFRQRQVAVVEAADEGEASPDRSGDQHRPGLKRSWHHSRVGGKPRGARKSNRRKGS
jgi:hypothetical protein